MNRIAFLVDGFNLYHSTLRLRRDTGCCTKWLDLHSLCQSYLHLFGKDSTLISVQYFSALPYHLSSRAPGKISRHRKYLSCLNNSGVIVELGRFKEKQVFCTSCRTTFLKHEEKETDVSIAVSLLELLFTDVCDMAVIMSGDTDLSPAVKKESKTFSPKESHFRFSICSKEQGAPQACTGILLH